MRHFAFVLALCLAQPAVAQDDERGFFDRLFGSDEAASDEEQGSLLERLIEDQLSGAGRVVEVTGFEGALSGAATLDSLTIADDDGVWLTLNDAELDWSRAALFQGRLEVTKLTAAEILLPRLPASEETEAPTPEATGFQLPELPVSIQIDEISAARVSLGAPLLGEDIDIGTEGAFSLEDGEGTATLSITRLDGRGAATLEAAYSNATRVLAFDLGLEEDTEGLLARLAGIPGNPSVDFAISGTAPIDEYVADIRLATDGVDRLTGQIGTFKVDETVGLTTNIAGDIAPLFLPEYRPFFGENVGLRVSAFRTEGGGTVLNDLSLTADHLSLSGEAVLGQDGMPRRFNLTGSIADESGEPVLLPLSGDETRVDSVALELAFNAAEGEGWAGRFDIENLERGAISADAARLRVVGQISPGAINRVTADVGYQIRALDLGDPSLKEAVGEDISGEVAVDWEAGRDLRLSGLTLEGEAYGLNGDAVVTSGEDGPEVEGEVALRADNLAVFSGVAQRPLGGRTNAEVTFTATPLQGTFDVVAKGNGQSISIGDARVDAILAGPSRLDLRATRDAAGLAVTLNTVESEQANLQGRVRLTSGTSTLSLAGRLEDAGILLDGLSGPVDLDLTGREDEARDWDVTARVDGDAVQFSGEGRLLDIYNAPRGEGTVTATAPDLSVFSKLAGRDIGGSAEVNATGSVAFDLSSFSIDGGLTGADLSSGIPDVDRLLSGETTLALVASGTNGQITLSRLALETGAMDASASGAVGADERTLDFAARVFNIAPFVSGLPGAAEVQGKVEGLSDGTMRVDVSASGPGGIRADIAGTAAEDFSTADLSINGNALLEIANSFIAPTTLSGPVRFDLRLAGPLDLASLSGQVTARDARLVAPDAGVAVSGISLDTSLGGGRATLDVAGRFEGGGRIAIRGPVGTSAPYAADLNITLKNAVFTDPSLFETSINGSLGVNGPLTGGARISGALALGPTEIRIPSSGLGGAGAIPEITHINEPPPVRGTRRRAGLLEVAGSGGGSGPAYPLDVTVTAGNQLFVRGRGLDSEFGGSLRLRGTTRNVIPSGGFTLIRGRLDILGQRLELDEARITMEGSFVPQLFLQATTEVDDGSVSVTVSGTADNPDIAFTSNPQLPQEEALARLIFGQGLENLSALQAARLALAVRTLAGRGGEGIVGKLRNSTGLADLDVTTTDEGNTAVQAGAYLGENLYTDVTVDSAGETQLNLNLDVSRSVTVKGGVSSEGGTSIGIFYERDY